MIEANSTYRFFDMPRTSPLSERERIVKKLAKKVGKVSRKLPEDTLVERLWFWRSPFTPPDWQNLMESLSWGERSVLFRSLSPLLSHLSQAYDCESSKVMLGEVREAKTYLGDGYIHDFGKKRIEFIKEAF